MTGQQATNEISKGGKASIYCPSFTPKPKPYENCYGIHLPSEDNHDIFGYSYLETSEAEGKLRILIYKLLKQPTRYAMLYELAKANLEYERSTGAAQIHFRHGSNTNYLYGDGHVGSKGPAAFQAEMLGINASVMRTSFANYRDAAGNLMGN